MADLESKKSVDQMSGSGEEPPPEYIVKDSKFGSIETSPPLGPFPVVDLTVFSHSSSSSSSSQDLEQELAKLRSSLSSAGGCFQVLNFDLTDLLFYIYLITEFGCVLIFDHIKGNWSWDSKFTSGQDT